MKIKDWTQIRTIIRRKQQRLFISGSEIANRSGLTQATVSRALTGKNIPSVDVAIKICKVLEISINLN